MEGPQEAVKTTNGVSQSTLVEEATLVDINTPQKMVEPPASPSESASSARRITRSQTTGRPTVRWGKYGRDDDSDEEPRSQQKGLATLKRAFDARAVDEETDEEGDQDPSYQPAKMARMELPPLAPTSSSMTLVDEAEEPLSMDVPPPIPSISPPAGEYTFLDASSSSFTAERRGPRIRTAPPVPVPNLTKKSRGRRVPTAGDAAAEGESAEGKKGRVYVCKVQDCGKCFSRGEHLKRHIRSIHTHEKPFKCPHPTCDKRFNRNDNLLQHLRVHKGDNSSQTSVDSGPAGEDTATAEGSSTPQRASSKAGNATRRTTRPVRKTKSAASTPPIPAARLAASRVPGRSLPLPLPRTYSMPPLSSLAPTYHSPAVAGFMNNTNIAVSSLRTAIDESDGEPETDTDVEARVTHERGHDIRSLYSFSRDLGKPSFRDPAYSVREAGQSEQMNGDVMSRTVPSSARDEHVSDEGGMQAKNEVVLSRDSEPSASQAEEVDERSTDIPSAAPSPPPSAVSVQ